MSIEKVKKFVKDHKGGIITGALGVAGLALGVVGIKVYQRAAFEKFNTETASFMQMCAEIDEAAKGCTHYTLAKPNAVWAAFDKDGNLIDAVKDVDGSLIDPKMLMVFGNKVEK